MRGGAVVRTKWRSSCTLLAAGRREIVLAANTAANVESGEPGIQGGPLSSSTRATTVFDEKKKNRIHRTPRRSSLHTSHTRYTL